MNLIEIAQMTETDAREYLEKIRWPDGPVCVHCGSANHTRLNGEVDPILWTAGQRG